jgi:hypothetical protein
MTSYTKYEEHLPYILLVEFLPNSHRQPYIHVENLNLITVYTLPHHPTIPSETTSNQSGKLRFFFLSCKPLAAKVLGIIDFEINGSSFYYLLYEHAVFVNFNSLIYIQQDFSDYLFF